MRLQPLLPFSDGNELSALWEQLPAPARVHLINLYSELVPRVIRAATSNEKQHAPRSPRASAEDFSLAP